MGFVDGDVAYTAMDMALTALIERRRSGDVRMIAPELVTIETLDDFAKRYAAEVPAER